MDPLNYTYSFPVPILKPQETIPTRKIPWDVLNQGICTFMLLHIYPEGEDRIIMSDIKGNMIQGGDYFHKVVTITPEAIYEYWAMIISAIGLGIVAIVLFLRSLYQLLPLGKDQ